MNRSICCYTYLYNKYFSILKCLNETNDHTYISKNSPLQKIDCECKWLRSKIVSKEIKFYETFVNCQSSYICVWFCFLIDTSNINTRKVIIISTIVSGIVLALVIAITTCLFWKSRQRQRYLLLQLHESKWICMQTYLLFTLIFSLILVIS